MSADEKKTRRTTLFRRYLRYSLLAVMVSMVILFGIFLAFLGSYWREDRSETMLRNTRRIAGNVEQLMESGSADEDNTFTTLVVSNMLNVVSDSINADVFMTDVGGRVILCKDIVGATLNVQNNAYCSIHHGYCLPPYLVQRTGKKGYSTMVKLTGMYRLNDGNSEYCMVVGTPITLNGQVVGNIYAVSDVQNGLIRSYKEIVKLFLTAAIISFIVTFALAWRFAYSLTKPLQEMSRLTKQYAKGDFSERIEVNGSDELQDLAVSLNGMAESLSVLEESRKSFIANVSHELKTPMTSIAGFIDGILDGTIPASQEKHYLRIVSKEVKRLSRLVVTMLTLSKIEAGEEQIHLTPTDLQTLIFNALFSFEAQIEEAGYEIEGLADLPSIKVMADPDLLFQVCYNLFDNAVKFTNPVGTIRVTAENKSDRVIVHISNTGEGISEQEQKRIFERFYKVDKSRSEHVKGVGLGLNLAQNIVRLHGGEITVSDKPEGFTTFTFWIPNNNKSIRRGLST